MFAVLCLPNFRLQAVQRWRKIPRLAAIIDSKKSIILEATSSAEMQGVCRGITATQGLAKCPELTILQRSPSQEECCSALLLEIAFRFSPWVWPAPLKLGS